jgi:hypothetical protein
VSSWHRKSPCKRDALPAELTALPHELAAFSAFLNPPFGRLAERGGNERKVAEP